MSAIIDIQRALNQIRKLERSASEDVRSKALALVTSTAADMARERRGTAQRSQKRAAAKPIPVASKPAKPVAPKVPAAPKPKPKPFTEPAKPIDPVETLQRLSNIGSVGN